MNVTKLKEIVNYCRINKWSYGWGEKINDITKSPPINKNKQCDCSALHRYLVYHAAKHYALVIPDGSANQNAWYHSQAITLHSPLPILYIGGHSAYNAIQSQRGKVYVCIADASNIEAGHIWIVADGMTYESHADIGPHSRPANTAVLERIVTSIYDITDL